MAMKVESLGFCPACKKDHKVVVIGPGEMPGLEEIIVLAESGGAYCDKRRPPGAFLLKPDGSEYFEELNCSDLQELFSLGVAGKNFGQLVEEFWARKPKK